MKKATNIQVGKEYILRTITNYGTREVPVIVTEIFDAEVAKVRPINGLYGSNVWICNLYE